MKRIQLLLLLALFCASPLFASDKLAGGIKAGSTSVSLPVELRKSADSTALTGITYSGVTGSYWRQGGTRTAITTATLSGPSASYASGGFVEVDATNMPGVYRFDVPDAAFATGADWVVVSLKVSTAFQQNFVFALESSGAAEVKSQIGTAGAGLTALGDSRLANLDAAVSSRSTYAGGDTSGTTTLLTRVPSAISLSSGAVTVGTNNDKTGYTVSTVSDKTGYSLSQSFPANFAALAITGGGAVTFGNTSIATVTTLTNLPSIPANWLGATGIASGALNGKGDWNTTTPPTVAAIGAQITSDHGSGSYLRNTEPDNADVAAIKAKTDALPADPASNTEVDTRMASFTLPANFAALAITAGGKVDINDKTGFSLTSAYDPAKTALQTGGSVIATNMRGTDNALLASSYVAPPTASAIGSQITSDHGSGSYVAPSDYQQRGVAVTLPSPAPAGYGGGGGGGGGLTTEQADELALTIPIKAKTDLLSTGSAITVVSPVSKVGNAITVRAGDSWLIPIDGLGDITGATKLWFSVNKPGAPDAQAKLFVEKTAGLLYVNGAPATDASMGVLAVDDAGSGSITLSVDPSVTSMELGSATWTVKERASDGTVTTLATGVFSIAKYGVEATE